MSRMTYPTAAPAPGIVDLHDRLQAGETLYGTFAMIGSPIATELLARAGFDWLIVDLEHGGATEAELLANLHAIGATSTAALVRPQSGERLRIGRALDLGAHGIMVPRVDVPDQAREAISFMRYPPDGVRGLALSTRGAGMGELGHGEIQAINRRLLGIIQIESPQRGRARRGPSPRSTASTSCSSGRPTCRTASASRSVPPPRLPRRARAGGRRRRGRPARRPGSSSATPPPLPSHRDLGFRFIGLGSDGAFVVDGLKAALDHARA